MRYLRFLAPILVLLLAAGACAAGQAAIGRGQDSRPKVIATFSVVGDLARNVGGDRISLVTLVGPNGDVHTFEPSPADSAELRAAALVLENGVGLEPWLDDLYASSGSQAARVVLTSGYPLLALDDPEHESADHQHASGELDPHVWQDPAAAIQMVGLIRDALIQADPANAAAYQANAEAYLAELRALEAWAAEQLRQVPEPNRKLVTTHESFNYFARRFGFTIIGTALPVTTEAADPSVGETTELIEKIKAAGVPTIFAENAANPRLIQQIAQAAGVRVGVLYDVLSEPGQPADNYPGLIRTNVSSIVAGLAP